MISYIVDRLKSIIAKGLLDSLVNTGAIQILKVNGLQDEVIDDVERIEDYGITSNPPINESEVVLVSVTGNKNQSIAVKVGNSKNRPTDGIEGDVIIWDTHGNRIHLKNSKIEITSSNEVIINNGDDFAVAFNNLKKEFNELNDKYNDAVAKYALHTHTDPVGGSTGTPSNIFTASTANIDNTKVTTVRLP